jgi:Protein of unknown function (DUF3800)
MLVLVDESGDCGLKFDRGSSEYFVCVAVLFSDGRAADACDKSIDGLRCELRQSRGFEFHFSHCSEKVRRAFLKTVDAADFKYAGIVVEKKRVCDGHFVNPKQLYEFAVRLACEPVRHLFKDVKVIIDKSGDRKFKTQLEKNLKAHMINAEGVCGIRNVTMEASHSNNLVQLADMICGAIGRSSTAGDDSYRTLVTRHETLIQQWP